MRNSLIFIIVSIFLTSCCLVTPGECDCESPKPFLNESTKDWVSPFQSQDWKFTTSDSFPKEQIIFRQYSQGLECIGGDECCINYPVHVTKYLFDTYEKKDVLLSTKAIKNVVEFTSNYAYSSGTQIATYDVNTGKFSKSNAIDLVESDTVIGGLSYHKVTFQKIDTTKIRISFNNIEFVKGIGILSFTDTLGQVWTRE